MVSLPCALHENKLCSDSGIGVAHKSIKSFEYNGYFIPAGSVVAGNTWYATAPILYHAVLLWTVLWLFSRAILRDEKTYSNPDAFDPTRFLTEDGELDKNSPDPIQAFGYGRRICPGRYFAQDAVWLGIASILAAFKIEKATDKFGKTVEPHAEFSPGAMR